ncbi:hypothetical protein [Syntrophotalea acetylenica]|uniref:hypothetical protein n=1 Tax=Syntrophotalea acetylenica TaxID=29542 RepID=UPI002A370062|nr:hypothetical protein [Syntrophotalea acetylenica]MDY0263313.1 hypothetical protein [Syntrophotalea acetylenica]
MAKPDLTMSARHSLFNLYHVSGNKPLFIHSAEMGDPFSPSEGIGFSIHQGLNHGDQKTPQNIRLGHFRGLAQMVLQFYTGFDHRVFSFR